MPRTTKLSLIFIGLLLVAGAYTLPTTGFQGFHDDTEDPCFGDEDPFCGGDGEAGQACFKCVPTVINEQESFRCVDGPGGSGDICTVTHTTSGVTCTIDGAPCG